MHDLAQEYLHSAELLAQRIRVLRAGLDALTGEPYFDALRRLECFARNITTPGDWGCSSSGNTGRRWPPIETVLSKAHQQPGGYEPAGSARAGAGQ